MSQPQASTDRPRTYTDSLCQARNRLDEVLSTLQSLWDRIENAPSPIKADKPQFSTSLGGVAGDIESITERIYSLTNKLSATI